ncbi:SPRY domain-containing protein [Thioalbus denitrificans]|uniref:SPRY domain-containing protein n=1 Tax=Thioalbus denitrificans TaxID=547122 RepID=A0A369CFS3_9GAMM|nr:SPRY domain-containing protein [Thioalbus denitrificans]RCX32088.1 SPRY domain-containing protein [Thioalbus denitrificans]
MRWRRDERTGLILPRGTDSLIHHGLQLAAGGSGTVIYATWDASAKGPNITLSGGDLTATKGGSSTYESVRATKGKLSGKWYWEVTVISGNTSPYIVIGIGTASLPTAAAPGSTATSYSYTEGGGYKYNNGSTTAYGATYATGDVIQVALDMTAGKIWWGKNGTWQASGDPAAGTGAAFTGLAGTQYPAVGLYRPPTDPSAVTANFGASAFSYSVPSGFNAGVY